ncbi:hypothetical protein LUD75_17045 [Epilithonimonas sp. JDS]|uniref:hypothetical protein n=1 Tax=Epilithonimonas sp. JDS TaxID=2902797 RepID=UPI001E3CF957|nr:hypothetical protein [Epilithonimonas sp. JDS]MCD9856432.1 hypothetical protein [Epilithonimonas sp. JDS]
MKKTLFLILLPIFFAAQKSVKEIKLDVPIRDYYGASTLKVIDERKDSNIGSLVYKGKTYSFGFPKGTATENIEDWFSKQNKKKGGRELILLIQDLNVYNSLGVNTNYCKLKVKLTTFLKQDSKYYALKRYEDILTFNPKEASGIPTTLSKGIEKILQHIISKSFKEEPSQIALAENELSGYYNILLEKQNAFAAKSLKNGVYGDFEKFYSQDVLRYRIVKDEKGNVVKAENPDNLEEKLRAPKIFAYVENGIAYHNTLEGFIPLNKNDGGFYIDSNRDLIYPSSGNTFGLVGALFGGIVGGVIGGTIDAIKANSKFNKAKTEKREKVYIDFMNGQYIFRD